MKSREAVDGVDPLVSEPPPPRQGVWDSSMHDLAIIIVSTNEAHWLRPCLRSVFGHVGDIEIDVVVADNESTDGTRELVTGEFAAARVIACENRGFSHANNRGWLACDARYALFLNPDTEILEGAFEELIGWMDAHPTIGLAGVKQVTSDGTVFPTIRRFPNALRMLGEAFGSESLPFRAPWLGERELDLARYEQEIECDWTSGSFMLARREALESAGVLDERSFIYGEEPDLCLRMRKAGWKTMHLPLMTILHHAQKAGVNPKMDAQNAFARLLYARKHFGRAHRLAFAASLMLAYALRAAMPGRTPQRRQRRAAALRSLRTMSGLTPPPFGDPPPTALAIVPTEQREPLQLGEGDDPGIAQSSSG
jgi:GT2 family glycosyltransferase